MSGDHIRPLDWLRAAIDDDRLTTTERAAVAAIARRAPGKSQPGRFAGQKSGWDFYLSRDELAGLMDASARTADRCLVRLHELEFIKRVSRGGRRGLNAVASVWRLSTPQHATSGALESGPNTPNETFPTRQMGASQHDTSGVPREHRYKRAQKNFQGSTANAQPLTRSLVHEPDATCAPITQQTQFHNPTTDRARSKDCR